MYLTFFLVCLAASVLGAVCGVGGGVIIKPVLDAFGVLEVSAISFLSGCTVLAMTTYSVVKSLIGKDVSIKARIIIFLAAGSAIGGILGRGIFTYISQLYVDKNKIGVVQAICLLVITIGTLIYTLLKNKIKTICITSGITCVLSGVFLGMLSAFLGIGGGPVNLIILFYFFSMTTKEAAEVSLYMIFFSQLSSLLSSVVSGRIPQFSPVILYCMILGGIIGGIIGRCWNQHLKESTVDKMFIVLMSILIAVNIYNICNFL